MRWSVLLFCRKVFNMCGTLGSITKSRESGEGEERKEREEKNNYSLVLLAFWASNSFNSLFITLQCRPLPWSLCKKVYWIQMSTLAPRKTNMGLERRFSKELCHSWRRWRMGSQYLPGISQPIVTPVPVQILLLAFVDMCVVHIHTCICTYTHIRIYIHTYAKHTHKIINKQI